MWFIDIPSLPYSKNGLPQTKAKLQAKGYMFYRGKYEMQFLFEFLRFIQNEPKKSRVYSVASCSIPFYQNTMLSTFSQYADVSDNLCKYIETGIRWIGE